MSLKIVTLSRLSEFLTECKALFSSKIEAEENATDIYEHLLNVDYSQIEFNTSEIIGNNPGDIVLDEDEAMLLSSDDDILIDISEKYITVEKEE